MSGGDVWRTGGGEAVYSKQRRSKAMNEVDAGRDRATLASVRHEEEEEEEAI
jgi:hypothetical protein